MKGQNLRIFLDDRCVAAALDCNFHAAVQTESATTCDSEGDFEELEVTDKTWDVSSSAVIVDGVYQHETRHISVSNPPITIRNESVYPDAPYSSGKYNKPYVFSLKKGQRLIAKEAYKLYVLNSAMDTILHSQSPGTLEYVPTDDEGVVIATDGGSSQGYNVVVSIVDDAVGMTDVIDKIKKDTRVRINFATTTGSKNREVDNSVAGKFGIAGTAIITDFTANAANKQRATFSFAATGVGTINTSPELNLEV